MNSENHESKENQENGFNSFRTVGRILLILFLGISLYFFVSIVVMTTLTKPAGEVSVPNVIGENFNDVYNSLVRKGLKPEIKFEDVYDIDDGMILSQYPASGSVVSEGDKLNVLVSRGKRKIAVPNVVGKELPFALNAIKNMHSGERSIAMQAGVISYIKSDKPGNVVIAQSPTAGEKVTTDTKVNLLVSAGEADQPDVMPEVVGQSIELCYDYLLAKGVTVIEEVVETPEANQSGRILSQSPVQGTAIKSGDIVTLKINYFSGKEKLYHGYEKVLYTIDNDDKAGYYEAVVDDTEGKRVVFAANRKPGETLNFVFLRNGVAKVIITRDKKKIKVFKINVDDFN